MKIMQCWDDSTTNDIRLVELFRRYNARATFNFIIPEEDGGVGGSWLYNDFPVEKIPLSEQVDLYKGYKVAGHGGRHHRLIPVEEFKEEVATVRACILNVFKQPDFGYAYPGGGFNDEIKQIVKDAGYKYARTTRNVDAVLTLDDPFELPSHCHFASDDFWTKYDLVKKNDGIFYFWGHSYEFMNDENKWSQFEATLGKIAADDQAEWIDIIDLFV